MKRHGKEWTKVEPNRDKDEPHESVEQEHGDLKEPFSGHEIDANLVGGRPLALVIFALQAHLVYPGRRAVHYKLVLVRIPRKVRSGCLDFEDPVELFVEDDLLADFSAPHVLLEEKVVELTDDLEC